MTSPSASVAYRMPGKGWKRGMLSILQTTSWVLDLDGVVWLADQPIPGAAAAVRRLQSEGQTVAFVTNNSNPTVQQYGEKLAAHGIEAQGRLVSSAMAAATLVERGERVLVLGGPGVREALAARDVEVVDGDASADAVVVGFHREFDYDRLRRASTAVRRGARLIATNDDATYPTPDGPIPGCGALVAAVERASGAVAEVAGKPFAPMAAAVRERVGGGGIVVGDRPDTDGRFARVLGFRFALVLSGVTTDASCADPAPDLVAADLAALVAQKVDQAGRSA